MQTCLHRRVSWNKWEKISKLLPACSAWCASCGSTVLCVPVRFTGCSVSLHICASLPETETGDLRRVCALQITLFFVMFSFILFTFTRQRNQIKHHKASFKVPKHTQSTSLGFPNSSPFVISFISCQVFRFSPPRSFALVHVYNIWWTLEQNMALKQIILNGCIFDSRDHCLNWSNFFNEKHLKCSLTQFSCCFAESHC